MSLELDSVVRPSTISSASWPDEPYKGLNYFVAADAPLFGQRDVEIEDCAARFDDMFTRVLLLHGLTGTGKSSFLRAGLIPRLEKPPVDGCRFFIPNGTQGQRLIVRVMDDPIGRIHDALGEVARTDERIPGGARHDLLNFLSAPIDPDRKQAAEALLNALEQLCDKLRDPLVLVMDQAEEVLTLPQQASGPCNRRLGLFSLLEGICLRRLRMRAIVAFRTEYYGQFCSFFRIRSTIRITSSVLPQVGLVDYLLQGLNEPERIAAAIERPTLKVPLGPEYKGLGPPFEKYRFEYAPGLAEEIARDLIDHSGDASTLPLMQIVCCDLYERTKQSGQSVIVRAAYKAIGGVSGALDSHIDAAIGGALENAGRRRASADEMNRWRMTLSSLVGQQEGSTVTTLVASEDQLVHTASDEGIRGDIPSALEALAQDRYRILRSVVRPYGTERAYSLGHDILGAPLCLWREKHGARIATEKRLRRRMIPLALTGVAVMITLALVLGFQTYSAHDRSINVLDRVATNQPSSGLRLRLLLLVASMKKSDSWPVFSRSGKARTELVNTLQRSPVFSGRFSAGVNAEGTRLVRIENGKVIIRDLRANTEIQPYELPPTPDTGPRLSPQPVVGLVRLNNPEVNVDEPVAMNGVQPITLTGPDASPVSPHPLSLPDKFRAGASFTPAEIAGGSLRFQRWDNEDGLISKLSVLTTTASAGPQFEPMTRDHYDLDWKPGPRAAWRVPVLGEDCQTYSFLGMVHRQDKTIGPNLWLGKYDQDAKERSLPGTIDPQAGLLSSVAIARECGAAVVRDKWSGQNARGELLLVKLENGELAADQTVRKFEIRQSMAGFVPSSFPQVQSPLAVAPRPGGVWRAAWLTDRGVEVADAYPEQEVMTPLFTSQDKEGDVEGGRLTQPLLTGLDPITTMSRLTLSKDGDFLFVSQQRGFGTPPDIRIFDLRRAERMMGIPDDDLEGEACHIAGQLMPHGDQLKPEELLEWLNDSKASQPCAGK